MFDTAIVLAGLRTKEGDLDSNCVARINLGVELYQEGLVSTLTMSGGYCPREARTGPTLASIMVEHVSQENIPHDHIFLEENSVDTVGQAVFTNRDIIIPNGMERVIVLSSSYHMGRVIAIFDFVVGDKVRKLYASASGDSILDVSVRAAQEESLKAFFRTFQDVKAGDQKAIEERLYSAHPLYMKGS